MSELTIGRLREVMRECAGEDESVNLDADIMDITFIDLGYDSLALLETASRLEREFGVALPEETVTEIETPRELISLVNDSVAESAGSR